jgi:hypothetical protein
MPDDPTFDDYDGDGVSNDVDACDCTPDPTNADFNADGQGDVCQDSDGDGILDDIDNCRATYNPYQEDFDEDRIGDVCDPDFYSFNLDDCYTDVDGDQIPDCIDNCVINENHNQIDSDNDGIGDTCDNCDMWNPNQAINPCTETDPTIIDPDCSVDEITAELEIYNNTIDCIAGAAHQYIQQSPIQIGEQGDPNHRQPRACILDKLSDLGAENGVLCEWWEHNPPMYITGAGIFGMHGAEYHSTCDDVDGLTIDQMNQWSNQIDDILHCCKSQYMIDGISARIETTRDILRCFPNPIPSTHCTDVKLNLSQMQRQYQLQLENLLNQLAETEGRISETCY